MTGGIIPFTDGTWVRVEPNLLLFSGNGKVN